MIVDFDFLKNGETVYKDRQDLGFLPGPPLASIGYITATFNLNSQISKGKIPAEAAEWDQVKIGTKTYARPQKPA